MSSCTEEAYVAVLRDFKNCAQLLTLNLVLTDFEMALRLACATVFPDCRLAGCGTHYDRVCI